MVELLAIRSARQLHYFLIIHSFQESTEKNISVSIFLYIGQYPHFSTTLGAKRYLSCLNLPFDNLSESNLSAFALPSVHTTPAPKRTTLVEDEFKNSARKCS